MDLPVVSPADVLADLSAGRADTLDLPEPLARRRPMLGGRQFLATLVAARVAVALRLPVAARLLDRLWFTPWVATRHRPRPAGARTRFVRADGLTLAGWEVGEGPTVLLVHGWGGRANDLAALGGALAGAGLRAVAVDLPGHGASPDRRGNLYDWGAWVRALGDGVGPIDGIVAHSLGSVAAVLALAEGLPASRLAAIAPPSRLDHAVAEFIAQTRLGPAAERRLRGRLEGLFGAGVWDDLDVVARAPRIDGVDVLVVHDADDPQVPVDEGRRVAAALGGRLAVTAGLGHGRVLADPHVLDTVVSHLAPGARGRDVTAVRG